MEKIKILLTGLVVVCIACISLLAYEFYTKENTPNTTSQEIEEQITALRKEIETETENRKQVDLIIGKEKDIVNEFIRHLDVLH